MMRRLRFVLRGVGRAFLLCLPTRRPYNIYDVELALVNALCRYHGEPRSRDYWAILHIWTNTFTSTILIVNNFACINAGNVSHPGKHSATARDKPYPSDFCSQFPGLIV